MTATTAPPTYQRQGQLVSRGERNASNPVYTFLVSTPDKQADGFRIAPSAWDLKRFNRHPNVLLNHRLDSLPIGKSERTWVDHRGLWMSIRFSETLPLARQVRSLIDEGILSSTSVNFRPHDVNRQTGDVGRCELIEASIVSVPEDAGVELLRLIGSYKPQPRSRTQEAILAAKNSIQVKTAHACSQAALAVFEEWAASPAAKKYPRR